MEGRFNPLDPLGIFGRVKKDVDRIASAISFPLGPPARRFDPFEALKRDIDRVAPTGFRKRSPIPSQPTKFSSPINYPAAIICPYGTRIGEPVRVTEIPKPETVPLSVPMKAPTNNERKKVPIPPEKVPLPEKVPA